MSNTTQIKATVTEVNGAYHVVIPTDKNGQGRWIATVSKSFNRRVQSHRLYWLVSFACTWKRFSGDKLDDAIALAKQLLGKHEGVEVI